MHLSLIFNGKRSLQTRGVRDCRNLTLCFWAQTGKCETAQEILQKWGAWWSSKTPEKSKIGDTRWPPQPDTHFAHTDGGKAENLIFNILYLLLVVQQRIPCSPFFWGKNPSSLIPAPRSIESVPQHWLFISACSPPAAKPLTGGNTLCPKLQNVPISVSHPKPPPDNAAAQNIVLYLHCWWL